MSAPKKMHIWSVSFTKDTGVHHSDAISLAESRRFQCEVCGISDWPDKPAFDPVPIDDTEPRYDMTAVWGLPVNIWSLRLFEALKPFMPRVTRWRIEPVGRPWKKPWIAFSVSKKSLVWGNIDGHSWKPCPVCGELKNTGMNSGKPLWFKRKDIKHGWFEGEPWGMYITEEVKSLPIWDLVQDKKFTKIEVRDA